MEQRTVAQDTDVRAEIVERLFKVLPYANQIRDLNLCIPGQIRFRWRSHHLSVRHGWRVEEVDNGMLRSDDFTMLLEVVLGRNARDY